MDDLEWDYEDIPYTISWSFNLFMDEYNRLYGFLNAIQEETFPANNLDEGPINNVKNREYISEQLEIEREKYNAFLAGGKHMSEKFPFLADDVLCRVELLAVKWEILQMFLLSKPNGEEQEDEEELSGEEEQNFQVLKCYEDCRVQTNLQRTLWIVCT